MADALTPIGTLVPTAPGALVEAARARTALADDRRLRRRAALDPERVAYWFGCIGDRIGRRLERPTAVEYYNALADAGLTTADFDRAARVVFASELFAQWPAVERFVEAARGPTAGHPAGTVAATLARLDAEIAAPRASDAAIAAFADPACGWRAALRQRAAELPAPRPRLALPAPTPNPAAEAELAAIAARNQARHAATMEAVDA